MRPGYKQTEVGVIPESWDVIPIGMAGEVLGGRQRSPHYVGERSKYLRVANVFDGFINTDDVLEMPFSPAEKQRFQLRDGDILLNEGQSIELIGRSAIYRGKPDNCCFQNTLLRFRAASCTCPEFAQVVFQQYLRTGVFASIALQTTSIAHLGAGRLAALKMSLPPKSEQKTIAEALSDADVLIESLEQLIAKKRQIKQGAMQELFTGKKRLPGFSGEWRMKTLGDLFSFSGGFTASRDQLSTDGHCYLHYGDIHTSNKTFIDVRSEYQEIPKLDIPLKRVSTVSLLDDGDVVFVDASEDAEGASKHVVIVNPDKTPFIAGLHTIVAKSETNELDHRYRRYSFQTPAVKAQFRFFAVGTKVSGISKTNIAKITLPLPSVPEQTAIAEILSDVDAEIAALETKLAKARQIKQGMMQELLTGRIRLV
jgi:type I restriction enzyme S subunit